MEYIFKNFEPFYLSSTDTTPVAWVSEKKVTINMNYEKLDYQNSYRFSEWLIRAVKFFEANERIIEKRKIRSSHLALRFYKSDGWNYEDVQSCLIKGIAEYQGSYLGDELGYWIGEVGSVFSAERLMAHDIYDYKDNLLKGDAATQYIKDMNW